MIRVLLDFAKNLTGHECYHGNEIDDTGCIDPVVGGRFSIHLEWNGLQCPERRNTITGTMAPAKTSESHSVVAHAAEATQNWTLCAYCWIRDAWK